MRFSLQKYVFRRTHRCVDIPMVSTSGSDFPMASASASEFAASSVLQTPVLSRCHLSPGLCSGFVGSQRSFSCKSGAEPESSFYVTQDYTILPCFMSQEALYQRLLSFSKSTFIYCKIAALWFNILPWVRDFRPLLSLFLTSDVSSSVFSKFLNL